MSFTLDSGKKIFDIIDALLTNPKSRGEIGHFVQGKSSACAKRSVSKYLKTLKKAGFDIRYENHAFHIFETPFKIKLSKDELCGLEAMLVVIKKFYQNETSSKIKRIEEKLMNLFEQNADISEEKLLKTYDSEIKDGLFKNIETLHHYIKLENAKLRIKYKNKNLIIVPKKLIYKINGIFLHAYFLKKDKNLILRADSISKIKFLNFIKENKPTPSMETVFRLTGRLTKSYILREGERARYLKDSVVVTSIYENKEELFNRLLKYGKFCEIISSKEDRTCFIKKLKSLKKHYKSM